MPRVPAGWQVTLCDPVWHVNSSSGVATMLYTSYFILLYIFYILL